MRRQNASQGLPNGFYKITEICHGRNHFFLDAAIAACYIFWAIVSAIAIIYGIVIIAQTLITGIDVPGYATTIVVVLFLGGVQLLVMGILGEYLAKTYIQGKHRPVYIAKNVLEKKNTKEEN